MNYFPIIATVWNNTAGAQTCKYAGLQNAKIPLVLKLINNNMGLVVERDDIERSHRLGRKTDGNGRPRTRPVMVRFTPASGRRVSRANEAKISQHQTP